MHIHIVDDDPVIRTLITDYVRYLGHHATTSETGEQALILLKNSTPDILLLDFQLPDITGAEVMTVLNEWYDPLPFPIVLLSANESDDIISKSEKVEPYTFLHKPFDMSALNGIIEDIQKNWSKDS